jgi:hypothetical protein
MKKNNLVTRVVALVVLVVLLISIGDATHNVFFSSTGYSSAFQGPKITFYGEEILGQHFTQTPTTTLMFDPLSKNPELIQIYLPEIHGSMTTVFLPEDSVNFLGWGSTLGISIPASWTQNLGLYASGWKGQSPEVTYNWTINGKMYYMAQYRMKWYVAFAGYWKNIENPALLVDPVLRPTVENVYPNLNMWFEIDTTPTWYIQGGGVAYFAIGKMQLDENVAMGGRDNNGNPVAARTDESTNPESASAVNMIYYAPWGAQPIASEIAPSYYEGKELNPNYFRNVSYCSVDLANFGVYAGAQNFFGTYTKGDTATFCFDLTAFVIGEYTVQDIQKDPTHFGYFTPTSTGSNIFSDLFGWLFSPSTLAWLIPVLIFVAILIFAPWLLVVILALIFGSRKSGGKG